MIQEEKLIDPSDLARTMWQTIYVATGKSPIKCLYNVVELLIFKFLSDLGVLDEDDAFTKVWNKTKITPEDGLTYYAHNSRVKILKLFPKGPDNTTIINGTIFVNEASEPNTSQAVLFFHSLKHLFDYGVNFGSFIKIDKSFKTKLYETFLKQEVEGMAQYFTTRKIVQSMVRMSGLDEESFDYKNKRICDPFCGVGGFLLEILNLNDKMRDCYIPDEHGEIHVPFTLNGFDKGFEREDERTIILAKANMLIYLSEIIFRYPKLTIQFGRKFNETFKLFRDNLATLRYIISEEDKKYNYILTNPPYITRGSRIIKEEIKRKGLSKYYPINGFGLESLSVEWVIRSLQMRGKAFVIVPNGLMERSGDKKLRDYLMRECYLDAIISLPVRTFFSNFRKTYILGFTKKENPLDTQDYGVFTYLVSNIGENLTQKTRDEIQQNDLPEMEQLFAMFSAVKTDRTAYSKIEGGRCKIIDPIDLQKSKHWRIEKWWTEDELKKLGLVEDEINLNEVVKALENTKNELEKLIKIENPLPDGIKFKNFKVSDIFYPRKGNSKLTKKYFKTHIGTFPVYSSQTSEDGVIAYIDSYEFNEQCLTWTSDGVYAGTVFLRDGKFNMTTHCGALIVKPDWKDKVYLPYIYHILKHKLRKFAVGQEGQNKRVTVSTIRDIEIEIPIKDKEDIDFKAQAEISIKFSENEQILDDTMKAKEDLIQILNKALSK